MRVTAAAVVLLLATGPGTSGGERPRPVAILQDARGEEPGQITFFDAETFESLGSAAFRRSPLPIRYDDAGTTLFAFDADRRPYLGKPKHRTWSLVAVDLRSFESRTLAEVGQPQHLYLMDPSGARLYVVPSWRKGKTGTVHVIDLAAGEDRGTLAVLERPIGLWISPDGPWLYAICEGKAHRHPRGPPGNLHVLDSTTGTELARFEVGSGASSLAFDRERGLAYVLGSRDEDGRGEVAVLRGATRVADFALPGRAQAVIPGPTGVAYVLAQGAVAELAPDGLSVARVWRLGIDPADLVFDAAHERAFAGEGHGSKIAEIDLARGTVVVEHSTGSPGKKAGKSLGLALATILAVAAAAGGGAVPAGPPWGHASTSMVLAPDGSALYVLNTFTNDISVFDPATHDVVGRVPTGAGGSMRILRAPEDPHLWVESRARLVRFNTDIRQVDRAIDLTEGIRRASVAFDLPRGRAWILLGAEIRVFDLRTGELAGTVELPSPAHGVWIDPWPPPSR